jgi:hypothetical protein
MGEPTGERQVGPFLPEALPSLEHIAGQRDHIAIRFPSVNMLYRVELEGNSRTIKNPGAIQYGRISL